MRTRNGAPAASGAPVAAACPPPGDEPGYRYVDRELRASLAGATGGLSLISMGLAGADWAMQIALSPGKVANAAQAWMHQGVEDAARCLPFGSGSVAPTSAHGEQRFRDKGWQSWPFRCWRDTFVRNEAFWAALTDDVDGLSRHHARLAAFWARQWLDTLSPGNVWWINPAVVRTTLATGGLNFLHGLQHWSEDLRDLMRYLPGSSEPATTLAYQPGRNVAITPGKVVFRNALFELIQYAPDRGAMSDSWREPVLIVPSWIMKYYILDLQPQDSLVRYLVSHGYSVFMISWKNPDASARDTGLQDYLREGLLTALDIVRQRSDGERVHAAGYCLGGTLLAIAAARFARDNENDPLASITLFATETDFTEPGELGLFIDRSALATLDALMWRQGYLSGQQMAAAFQMLNARDLVWSRMMSEYLLGRRLRANDLISWNRDTTRLPYRLHSDCLHKLFLGNELAEGKLCVDGRPVALSDIHRAIFMVGTEHDHVSPWQSVYKLHLLTGAPLTFLLTSGGHNAGIVSEPDHPRRHYRIAMRVPGAPYRSPEQFLSAAAYHEGSWWPAWSGWLAQHCSGRTTPRDPTPGALGEAPGTYVLER